MKQKHTRDLYEYWTKLRGRRTAPERNSLDPGLISHALPDIFLLEFGEAGEPEFRLAGTRLCSLFDRELSGTAFLEIWVERQRQDVADLVGVVSREETPLVAGTVASIGDGRAIPCELLLLPLRHNGMRGQRMLGLMTAADELPLFMPAAVSLSLTTLKVVDSEDIQKLRLTPSFASGIPAETIVSRKGHLVLIEGKRV